MVALGVPPNGVQKLISQNQEVNINATGPWPLDILQCIFPQISAFLLWRLKNQPLGRNSSLETLNIDIITSDPVVKI